MLISLIVLTILLTASLILNVWWYKQKHYIAGRKRHYKNRTEALELELQGYRRNHKSSDTKVETVQVRSTSDASNDEVGNDNFPREHFWTFERDLPSRDNLVESIFFQSPIADCQFLKYDASDEQKSRFLYRIELTPDQSSGTLYLEPKHPSDLELIRNFPESILENACIYDNPFSADFGGVVQVAPGAVVSDGDIWRITDKIRIQFT
jgi:hypothetical protein